MDVPSSRHYCRRIFAFQGQRPELHLGLGILPF
jgi:hypothetical protein